MDPDADSGEHNGSAPAPHLPWSLDLPHGRVDLPLIVDWSNRPRQHVNHETGKPAQTDWRVLGLDADGTTRVRLFPLTGRSHQLRVHMLSLGHPILGDGKYGGGESENLGDGWGAGAGGDLSKKLHLHARSLTIEHPITKKQMTFTAPLPEHMARTWKLLDWKEDDVPADPFEVIR